MTIRIKHIKKNFKNKCILKGVSFDIPSASISGLLGINGAGKSTLMKILYGLETADEGEILYGHDWQKTQKGQYIGALIEAPAIYSNLSAFDNLKTKAFLYQIPSDTIFKILDLVGLSDTGRKKAGHFSLGMKQRLGIGMALLTYPKFLILDEPTNGLDPDGIKDLLELIVRLKNEGMTILISSHQLHEISQIADDITILHQGEIVYHEPNYHDDKLEQLFFKIVHGGY